MRRSASFLHGAERGDATFSRSSSSSKVSPYLCLFLMAKPSYSPPSTPCAPERLDNVHVRSDGMALYSAPFRCHVPSGESNRLTSGCSDGREGEMASGMPPSRLHTHPCQGTTATCHPDTPSRNVSLYSPLRQSIMPSERTMSYRHQGACL